MYLWLTGFIEGYMVRVFFEETLLKESLFPVSENKVIFRVCIEFDVMVKEILFLWGI